MRFKLLVLILAASCLPAVALAMRGPDRATANGVLNGQRAMVAIDVLRTVPSNQTRGIALIGYGNSICLLITQTALASTPPLMPHRKAG